MTEPRLIANGAARAEAWIRQEKIIAILRVKDAEQAIGLCQSLVKAGLSVAEITADSEHAISSVATLRDRLGDRALLGVGTVLDPATAEAAADAGADFCVAPNLDAEVVAACSRRGLLAIPGVLTPTEVVAATRLGLSLVKLFPCGGLAPAFLTALRAPFAAVGFVPTGGIDRSSVGAWLKAGAAAVGLGSSLVSGESSDDAVSARVREIKAQIPR